MNAVLDIETCVCSLWEKSDNSVRFCSPCHRYYRGSKELTSVSKLIRNTWPIKKEMGPDWMVENARQRGVEVDRLFCAYASGALKRIPAGTRQDAVELFYKVRQWFDSLDPESVSIQTILADSDTAGTCDIIIDGYIWDLKCTYSVDVTYPLQLGLYADNYEATFGEPVKGIGILHATERFKTVKPMPLNLPECLEDARLLKRVWQMAHRRTAR